MCGSGIEIKLGGQAGIFAFKSHFTVSRSQNKELPYKSNSNTASPALTIPGPPTLNIPISRRVKKIRSFQRLDGFELQYFTYGPGVPLPPIRSYIEYTILTSLSEKNLFYQKVAAYPCSIIMLGIFGMSGIANFIICFHTLFICV